MQDGLTAGTADLCIDGSRWEDSPEARRKWVEWFDSLLPVLSGVELARFEAELQAGRDEQKALLHQWEQRIDKLTK